MSIANGIFSRVPVKALVPAVALQYRLFEPELRRLHDFGLFGFQWGAMVLSSDQSGLPA